MKSVLAVIGTRPEAIKMAPVVMRLRESGRFEVSVCATGQHRELLDQVFDFFKLVPDVDFNAMRVNQSLSGLSSRVISEMGELLSKKRPDAVLVQGDTTTVLATAIAAYYSQVPLGHVEAGLRTWDMKNPFPEEGNRVVAGALATWHFAPTFWARDNLLKSGIRSEAIEVTGNTVIDALYWAVAQRPTLTVDVPKGDKLVLVTTHRRENFGTALDNICRAIAILAQLHPDTYFLFPVHLNPNVRSAVYRTLDGIRNVVLTEPLSYGSFVAAMSRSLLILSDSGGVQEEGPALHKPVLVLREETERPEAIEAGVAKLVGTNPDRIVSEVEALLGSDERRRSMQRETSPFGDGKAAERIAEFLWRELTNGV